MRKAGKQEGFFTAKHPPSREASARQAAKYAKTLFNRRDHKDHKERRRQEDAECHTGKHVRPTRRGAGGMRNKFERRTPTRLRLTSAVARKLWRDKSARQDDEEWENIPVRKIDSLAPARSVAPQPSAPPNSSRRFPSRSNLPHPGPLPKERGNCRQMV
jgi:hypothetical protein